MAKSSLSHTLTGMTSQWMGTSARRAWSVRLSLPTMTSMALRRTAHLPTIVPSRGGPSGEPSGSGVLFERHVATIITQPELYWLEGAYTGRRPQLPPVLQQQRDARSPGELGQNLRGLHRQDLCVIQEPCQGCHRCVFEKQIPSILMWLHLPSLGT